MTCTIALFVAQIKNMSHRQEAELFSTENYQFRSKLTPFDWCMQYQMNNAKKVVKCAMMECDTLKILA